MTQDDATGGLDKPHAPLFVWWSTECSVANRIPSVLASFEVLIAVAIYWAIAIHFETFTHLWLSICIAPLLLLRSDQSTALGIALFKSYLKTAGRLRVGDIVTMAKSFVFWIGWFVTMAVLIAVSYVVSEYWLIGQNSSTIFWRSVVLGFLIIQLGHSLAVAVAVVRPSLSIVGTFISAIVVGLKVGALGFVGILAGGLGTAFILVPVIVIVELRNIGILRGLRSFADKGQLDLHKSFVREFTPTSVITTSSTAFGIWLRSVAIRFAATIRFLADGFWAIPRNFNYALFIVDLRHPAELIPGYREDNSVTSEGIIGRFTAAQKRSEKVFHGVTFVIFFLPAFLYRLSIKSTCWLYLPLVYITSERYSALTPIHLLDRLGRSPWERWRRFIALVTLAGFALITLIHNVGKLPELFQLKSVSPLEFFFVIDFDFWRKPWQVCSLLSAAITVYLIAAAGHARVDLVARFN